MNLRKKLFNKNLTKFDEMDARDYKFRFIYFWRSALKQNGEHDKSDLFHPPDTQTQELGTVFRRLGERPTDKELQEMVDEVDEDKNGTIEFDEFLMMMANRIRDSDRIQKVFKVMDKNDDG